MSPRQQTWRDLVASGVAEACPGLSTGAVRSAIAAAAPSGKALSVLARSLGPGPGALAVGAPPVAGRLVRELRARGATLPEPVCARCGRAHPKLAVTAGAGLWPPLSRPPQCHRLWALWGGQGGLPPRAGR